ncbi:MAG: ABC transporter ATP-binding protein/permease, partial [Lachnospiraceae bacterium]|nr:ABC transporter ATP-binding protein/permease [Lachnospiraceae bacterium]
MKETKENQETLFVRDRHIWSRFFKMLWKARLPYLWIAGYVIITMLISNMNLSVTEYTSEMFAGNLSFTGVILPWMLYSLFNLLTAAVSNILSGLCSARISRNLRRMVWDKVTRLPMRYFGEHPAKELLSRIASDTTSISTLIIQVILPFFTGLYTLVITFRKVGSYDSVLMWSLLAVVPFVLVIAFVKGQLNFGISDTVNRKGAELSKELSEKVTNLPLIKSFANEEQEGKSAEHRMREVYRAGIISSWISNLSSPINTIVGTLQLIAIILIGRDFYSRGAITLAQWIAYLAFAQQIANTLQAYAGYWASFKSTQGGTRRVTYIMDEENESTGTDRMADDLSGDIEFADVSFSYGEEKVLDHFSLKLPEGKITALIGLSGSGKTTLLNLLTRFYEPDEGTITIGGE